MNYNVGQVIFLLIQKEMKVVPAQVVEETVTKTLSGEKTSYTIEAVTANNKRKLLKLDTLSASVFLSIEEVHNEMVSNITKRIETILNDAKATAVNIFGNDFLEIDNAVKIQNSNNEHEDYVSSGNVIEDIISSESDAEIDLGNGMKAKINLKNINV